MLRAHLADADEPLDSLKGRVVLLSFWAIWCTPCMKELPALVRLAEEHPGRVVLRAVYEQEASSASLQDLGNWKSRNQKWLQGAGASFDQYIFFGNRALHDRFPHRGLPTTYVLDGTGAVVEKLEGVELTVDDAGTRKVKDHKLREAVARALERSP